MPASQALFGGEPTTPNTQAIAAQSVVALTGDRINLA